MYSCKNCGGNLRFDIPTQRLKCPYCDSDYDCYELDKDTNDRTDSYDVNILSCPACGAEIISGDQGAAEFCSYCGSSVVLTSRLRREKRPQKILPFQITSDDCIKAYKQTLGGAVFAPSALKDPKFLENFRGIYIPYWSYSFTHKGEVSLSATDEYRRGDYDITDHYRVTGQVDAEYDGILFDASASFDDSISRAIAPYDSRQMKEFTPSYLSGFYADVADVPAKVYQEDANNMANNETLAVICQDREAGRYNVSTSGSTASLNRSLSTMTGAAKAAMMPVWFLTWRDRDRVAYIAVNGQTGKVAADIPIDIKKYSIASLLCAIPLYFLLNILFSFTAPTSLFLAGIFAFISGIIYYNEIKAIRHRDSRELDRGFQVKKAADKRAQLEKEPQKDSKSVIEKYSKKGKEEAKRLRQQQGEMKKRKDKPLLNRILHTGTVASFLFLFIAFAMGFFMTEDIFSALLNRYTLNLVLICAVFSFWEIILLDGEEINKDHKPQLGIIGSQLAAILSAIVNIIHPVSDLIYYGAIMLVYAGILSILIQLILKYNLLITHPLPDLHNRGKESA